MPGTPRVRHGPGILRFMKRRMPVDEWTFCRRKILGDIEPLKNP